jgi:hypothetical protein
MNAPILKCKSGEKGVNSYGSRQQHPTQLLGLAPMIAEDMEVPQLFLGLKTCLVLNLLMTYFQKFHLVTLTPIFQEHRVLTKSREILREKIYGKGKFDIRHSSF